MHSKAGIICRTDQCTAAANCQTKSGHNSRDQPEKGIDGYGGKDCEKKERFRMREENVGRNVKPIQDQSMMMEKSWVMMKD